MKLLNQEKYLVFLFLAFASAGCFSSVDSEINAELASPAVDAPVPVTPSNPTHEEELAGEISSVPLSFPGPTLTNISVEWVPEQKGAAEAKLQFRTSETAHWQDAMPMRLVKAGGTSNSAAAANGCATNRYCWPERYAGSILDLEPGTTYEVRAYIANSEGTPVLSKTGMISTRAIPAPMAGAPMKQVTSSTTLTSALSAAIPGDLIQLSAGTYSGFTMTRSGTEGKPIVLRGVPGTVINGNVYLQSVKYVHLENVTVNGTIRIDHAAWVAVIGNTVNSGQALGIGSGGKSPPTSEHDLYIADNVIKGAAAFVDANIAVDGGVLYEGIQLTGYGHVITNNKVSGYRDCISFFEGNLAGNQYSIDILNNDLSECVDDAIEADSCFGNCRVMRNRITNTFMGISSQPTLGGPSYMIRNVLFNVLGEPFKLHNDTRGDVILNNTIVKNGDAFAVYDGSVLVYDAWIRNNLMVGSQNCNSVTNRAGSTYKNCNSSVGKLMSFPTFSMTSSSTDYQGYGVVGVTGVSGRLGSLNFTQIPAAPGVLSGNETHSLMVDSSVFLNAVSFPGFPSATIESAPDLRIGWSASVIGKALLIPNVNDSPSITSPAIGAYELGAAIPVYGPR